MDEQLATAASTSAYSGAVSSCARPRSTKPLGRPASAHLEHALWQQTATLLRQRRDWDRDHQVSPPPIGACLPCAVAVEEAPTTLTGAAVPAVASCTASSSTRASTPTRPATAPARADPERTRAVLEHNTQLLGATLLAQPA